MSFLILQGQIESDINKQQIMLLGGSKFTILLVTKSWNVRSSDLLQGLWGSFLRLNCRHSMAYSQNSFYDDIHLIHNTPQNALDWWGLPRQTKVWNWKLLAALRIWAQHLNELIPKAVWRTNNEGDYPTALTKLGEHCGNTTWASICRPSREVGLGPSQRVFCAVTIPVKFWERCLLFRRQIADSLQSFPIICSDTL